MKKRDPNRPVCPPGCKGETHPDCAGHNGRGQDCAKNRIAGGRVCPTHGGAAKQVKAAAARRVQEGKVMAAAVTYGLPIDSGVPVDELLLQEVYRTAGHVAWVGSVVAGLEREALVWAERQSSHEHGLGAEGPIDKHTEVSGAGINVWLDLYLKERKHFLEACKIAIAAGLEERRVRLAEQSGERHGQWLMASTAKLGLTDEQMRILMEESVLNLHLLEAAA